MENGVHQAEPLLMVPGPVPVSNAVRRAMAQQVVCHYGADWARQYNDTVSRVQQVLGTRAETFIYSGSGHLGLDAVCNSLLDPGTEVIVLANGTFGQRLAEVATAHELTVRWCDVPWGSAIAATAATEALTRYPHARAVLLVQTETSAGIRNDVEAVAARARAAGRLVVVDAVASAGVSPLVMDAWGIDVLVTASQKGLGAPPGLVIVAVGDRAWEAVEARTTEPRGWYANLACWRRFARERRDFQPYFITMAVNNLLALHCSLGELLAEGLERRVARHRRTSLRLRQGLRDLGLTPVGADSEAAEALTAVLLPVEASALAWRDRLEEDEGIVVSTGLGPHRDQVLRLGHMGPQADRRVLARVLSALGRVAACNGDTPARRADVSKGAAAGESGA